MFKKKSPIILVHGYRGSNFGLTEIAENLRKEGYHVYTPNIPPFGDKNNSLSEYTEETYSNFLKDYIIENKIEKPILAGHSMGSLVVAATAERYPELLADKIILMGPISNKPPRWIAGISPLGAYFPNSIVSYASSKYLAVKPKKGEMKSIYNLTVQCAEEYTNKKDVVAAGKFSDSHQISDFNFKQKALFIAGNKDRLVPKKYTVRCAEQFNAELVILEDAGHLINYQNPERVASAIVKFLK